MLCSVVRGLGNVLRSVCDVLAMRLQCLATMGSDVLAMLVNVGYTWVPMCRQRWCTLFEACLEAWHVVAITWLGLWRAVVALLSDLEHFRGLNDFFITVFILK